MTFRPTALFPVLGLSLGLGVVPTASADLLLTGEYDSATTNANQIDTEATDSANANQLSLTQFKTLVETAFAGQTGGVATFDQAGDSVFSGDQRLYFADNSVLATFQRTNAGTSVQTGSTNRTPISGASGFGGSDSYGFTFSVDDQITAVGVTLISRLATASDATVTATFADAMGAEVQQVAATSNLANSNGGDDTFFGFAAPTGKYLTGLTVSTPGYFTWADDLGVVTGDGVVPEPGSMGLLALGLPCLAARRRR